MGKYKLLKIGNRKEKFEVHGILTANIYNKYYFYWSKKKKQTYIKVISLFWGHNTGVGVDLHLYL